MQSLKAKAKAKAKATRQRFKGKGHNVLYTNSKSTQRAPIGKRESQCPRKCGTKEWPRIDRMGG